MSLAAKSNKPEEVYLYKFYSIQNRHQRFSMGQLEASYLVDKIMARCHKKRGGSRCTIDPTTGNHTDTGALLHTSRA